MKILLIGNPNVGKGVVFNRLTGVDVISSNYPGTTIDYSKGFLNLAGERIDLIDVPGTYSLEPTYKAEEIAVQLLKIALIIYLLKEKAFPFVGVAGFEPATPCSQSRCANRTALHPDEGMGVGVGVTVAYLS
jgi:ribosome biogenesis GTPase A